MTKFPLTMAWLYGGEVVRFRIAVIARCLMRQDLWLARRRVKELLGEPVQ